MQMIISDIMEWCQNDMNYLQELIDELQNIVNNNEEQKDAVEEKLINRLYNFWKKDSKEEDKELLDRLKTIIYNHEVTGAEELCDWCRDDYDSIREDYQALHNLTDDEMEQIMDDNFGAYEFMYNDIPRVSDLDKIWDICNWYLDYCDGSMDAEKLLELIGD